MNDVSQDTIEPANELAANEPAEDQVRELSEEELEGAAGGEGSYVKPSLWVQVVCSG